MKTHYCHYCMRHKDPIGFKLWRDRSNMPRSMCPHCQNMRKMTPSQRAEADRSIKESKSLAASEQARKNATKKRDTT